MKQFSNFLAIGSLFFLQACNNTENTNTQKLGDILSTHLDTNVVAGNDFFEYANGGWFKTNPIPDDKSGYGIFNLVEDENLSRVKTISEEATAAHAQKGTSTQQIGDFFSAGMDSISIEKNGTTPLNTIFEKINSCKTNADIVPMLFYLQQIGVKPIFDLGIGQDMKLSEKNRLYFSQGGLGLPNRDYYFNTDAQTSKIRQAYPLHIQQMLTFLYNDTTKAKTQASDIFQFEMAIAKLHKKLAELRDPYANYTKVSINECEKIASNFHFKDNLKAIGIETDSVIFGQVNFYKSINSLLANTQLETLKAYLTWHTLTTYASFLSSNYSYENFLFYEKKLSGIPKQQDRWKRVLDAQENAIGDALGQLFVKQYFPEKTKKRYEELTDKIVDSYREHIQKLDWMSDSTKQKAIVKLNAITKKVGYPSKWKDYSNMNITRNSYCGNILEANKWHFNYEAQKLNKPVDRTEWGMTPQTYNAYYNPSNNEIVLPAAIFITPGYKDEEVDDAVIYGYVGASTIGHELTHGFDDEGRQFDEKGNLKNWWSKEDEKRFKERASLLIKQFNDYVVLDSLHPNGEATLGENIADLGGIVIALDAFKKTKQYQEGKSIAGLTPLQRYFLGYAYGWMQVRRKEKLADQLLTDVHAPIFLRVNGPMSNCDEWYKTFNVNAQHKMYRDTLQRVRIW